MRISPFADTDANRVGTFLMGTVKGDVHDIGKNLCNIMLEGAGFTVIDLGVNVPPEKFVEEINKNAPDIVGFSAFLTTTMPMFKANINALQKAGLRDQVLQLLTGEGEQAGAWTRLVRMTVPADLHDYDDVNEVVLIDVDTDRLDVQRAREDFDAAGGA